MSSLQTRKIIDCLLSIIIGHCNNEYLPGTSVPSFHQDRCIVQLWDHKELHCNHRSEDSSLHSFQLGRLATQNTQQTWCNRRKNKRLGYTTVKKIIKRGSWTSENVEIIITWCLFIQPLPKAPAVITELNCPCHDLACNLSYGQPREKRKKTFIWVANPARLGLDCALVLTHGNSVILVCSPET